MLVSRVEFRSANDQNSHFADGPVLHAGRDEDGCQGPYRVPDAVKFDGCPVVALHDHVNLRVVTVVMGVGVH